MTPPETTPAGEPAPASEAPAVIHLPYQPLPDQPARKGPRRGRHFGARPVDDPRGARLDMRCTPAVRAKAEAGAAAAGISVAGYVAQLITGDPGPRVHRNPSEASQLLAQILGQLGKRGSNLNQGARALNEINLAAGEGEGRDRLAELIEDMAVLHREGIAEHRECVAAILRALGLRPDADHY